jgi:dihydroorotase
VSAIVIRGGRVIDPASDLDGQADVLIEDGRVSRIGSGLSVPRGAEAISACGLWVVPGLIDMHVHLREPGGEAKETIASGARASAAGGFAAVLAMPNTVPPVDSEHMARYVRMRGRRAAGAKVLVAGTLTALRRGERPADIAGMARAGAVAFTDDGDEVRDARVLRAAMRECAALGAACLVHAEDPDLVQGGHVNEGIVSTALGLAGRPALAETIAVARDIALARDTGVRLHIQHVSTAGAIREIERARSEGVSVTCEAAPHHLLLTEDACRGYDPATKVNPPLRSEADRQALVDALVRGVVDVVASDHAPHTAEDKGLEFDAAAAGISGVETALALMLTELVHKGLITPARLVHLMSRSPARILGLEGWGTLAPGSVGSVTLIDPDAEWNVAPEAFISLGRNTPFGGRTCRGRAVAVVVEGRIVRR